MATSVPSGSARNATVGKASCNSSDMYRLVHGKMLWVVTAIVVVASVLVVAMMHAVSSPEFLSMTASAVDMTVTACEDEGARGAASGDEAEGSAAFEASVGRGRGAVGRAPPQAAAALGRHLLGAHLAHHAAVGDHTVAGGHAMRRWPAP